MIDFRLIKDFFDSNRDDFYKHFSELLKIKNDLRVSWGATLNINDTDYQTFFNHVKMLCYVLRWHGVFKNKRVIDVGAGCGGAYLALRYGKPKQLIAVEPNQDNYQFLVDKVRYDDVFRDRWQDYRYEKDDCVFLRNTWIVDWNDFLVKMASSEVKDIVIISDFVNINNASVFAIDNVVPTPHRFSSDVLLPNGLFIPSIAFIKENMESYGYRLMEDKIYANEGHKRLSIPYFSLHFARSNKHEETK